MKTGYKTTEFWLSLAAMVLAALIGSGVFDAGGGISKLLVLAASALTALGYTVARSMVKNIETKAAALTAAEKVIAADKEPTP
jgi:hypothetical protein